MTETSLHRDAVGGVTRSESDYLTTAEPDYLTTEELALKLRTTPETCRYWRHIGKGPRSFKVGRRVLYAAEDVERFIAEARGVAV